MDINKRINLWWLAFNHAAVDLVSAYLVIGALFFHGQAGRDFFIIVLVYGVTAFALQPLMGRMVDWTRQPYRYLWLANFLILLALIINWMQGGLIVSIVIAGLGNALWHVTGGTIGLNIDPGKAWPIGILVGPGAAGLFLGGWLARQNWENYWLLELAMILIILATYLLPQIKINYQVKKTSSPKIIFGLLAGLLTIVGLRSIIGFSLVYSWKSNLGLAVGLVLAVVAGKMLAGLMADRWGWQRMSLILVAAALPLLVLGFDQPVLAMIGAFCFQITMPVTLSAVARLQPGWPGWAFGLPCFFLIMGAIVTFFTSASWLSTNVGWLIAGQWLLILVIFHYFKRITGVKNV